MSVRIQSKPQSSDLDGDHPPPFLTANGSREYSQEGLRYLLARANFYTPGTCLRPRLITLFHRMRRGLISYDSCSIAELQKFLADRGLHSQEPECRPKWSGGKKIHWKTREKIWKDALVASLELADDEVWAFGRFGDLRPELRARVYQLYFSGLELSALCPAQPPITRVSHLCRQESLPLFYSICTFQIKAIAYEVDREEEDRRRDGRRARHVPLWVPLLPPTSSRYTHHIRINDATTRFFAKTDDSNVARIKNIRVSLSCRDLRHAVWDVKLGVVPQLRELNGEEDGVISDKLIASKGGLVEYYTRWGWAEELKEGLVIPTAGALAKVIAEINSRTGLHELRKDDISDFGDVLKDADERFSGGCLVGDDRMEQTTTPGNAAKSSQLGGACVGGGNAGWDRFV